MRVSNAVIIGCAAIVAAGILGHQLSIRRNTGVKGKTLDLHESIDRVGPATSAAQISVAEGTVRVALPGDAESFPPDVSEIIDSDAPYMRHRTMDEQVRSMYHYAAMAGADDPFALTPEEIEAFREQGDPTVW